MKVIKIFSLLLMFALTGLSVSAANTHKVSRDKRSINFKSWEITESRTGGFAGIMKSYALDSEGTLSHRDRTTETTTRVSETDISEIRKMLRQLSLPGTNLKTVRGKRIADGFYYSLTITLDKKEYKVEGSSFGPSAYLALTPKQQATLDKLKGKLQEIGAVV